MNTRTLASALTVGIALMTASVARSQNKALGNGPEDCKGAVQASSHAQMMQNMHNQMARVMNTGMQGMMGQLTET